MKTIKPYDPIDWTGVHVPRFRDEARCWRFLRKNGFHRLPEKTELVFLNNLKIAIDYAQRIDSRLPVVFETEIKKSAELSWRYVERVICEPFPEFEESLAQEPMYLVKYSKHIVKGRLPVHLEEKMVGHPYACFEYAWQILNGRLPENLHNYMFGAVMDDRIGRKGRYGSSDRLPMREVFDAEYCSPKDYFEFIKWQRKDLARQIKHYSEMYSVDETRSVSDLLFELEHGR